MSLIKYKGTETLENLGEARNYNKWIFESFQPYIEPPVIEIGCGTGNMSSFLLKYRPLYITDNDPGLVNLVKNRFGEVDNLKTELFDISKQIVNKYLEYFHTALCINVLEHIKNDEAALRKISRILSKNGKLLLLVPANKYAYTKFDKFLGHYRRYEKDELIRTLNRAGFKIRKVSYFNSVGLIAWLLKGAFGNTSKIDKGQIHLFEKFVPLIRCLEKRISPPLGISLVVVAIKE